MATSSQQGRSVSVTEIKTTVRLRDRFRCRECGMTNDEHVAKYGRTLDVHRLSPGSKYTVDGCVTLCRKCHAKHPKSDHATDGHSGHLLPARVPDCLWDALKKIANAERRSVAQMTLILLEEALTRRGMWPPPQPDKE
jgi:hypothetical protein